MSTVVNRCISYSAILCTFNAEATVEPAISSILNQTIKPNEIIIVDDASMDSTNEKISDLIKSNKFIKYIPLKENKGQSAARNLAAQSASGDVLIFFDDDDISNPGRSKFQLTMHLDAQISYVSSKKIYANGYELNFINQDISLTVETRKWVEKLTSGAGSKSLDNLWIPCSTAAISRSFFLENGGFDESMRRLEDVDYFLKASLSHPKVAWSSKVMVNRFDSDGPDKGGRIDAAFEKVLLNKYKSFLPENSYKKTLNLLNIREAYFGRSYLKLAFYGITNINLVVIKPVRIIRFLKRILHDIRKNK